MSKNVWKTYRVQYLHTVEVKARNRIEAEQKADNVYCGDYTSSVYDIWNEDDWSDLT